jgi:hypothetical protein
VAVSALRALAVAQWHSSIATNRKQLGPHGQNIFFAGVLIGGAFTILPLLPAMLPLGFLFARGLAEATANTMAGVSISLLFLALLIGVLFNLGAHSTRHLPWNQLRAFPLSTRTLFWAEFLANGAEPSTLFLLLSLGLFSLGGCLGAPLAAPFFGLLFLTHAALLLSLKQVIAGLMHQLISKLKFVGPVLIVLGMSALLSQMRFVESKSDGHRRLDVTMFSRQRIESIASTIDRVTLARPFLNAAQSATKGILDGEQILPMLAAILAVGLLVALAYWLTVNEHKGARKVLLNLRPLGALRQRARASRACNSTSCCAAELVSSDCFFQFSWSFFFESWWAAF